MSSLRPGTCGELGPYGAHCSDYPGHQYSHYDGGEDTSWQDDWRTWTHINGGGCDEGEDEGD